MITIQSAMLVSLGFLLASLMALMFAPVYRARTVRLTTSRLKKLIPLTEEEIRAERDRVRTQYALRVHELERQLEKAKLSGARQQVELNRRDARISGLEEEIAALKSDLEQHSNARRVLEQTIVDRVPAIEQRLAEAKALLAQRDRELAALTGDTTRTVRALDDALQANAHQRAEIERLSSAVGARGARSTLQARPEALLPAPSDATPELVEAAKEVNGGSPADGGVTNLPAPVPASDAAAIEQLSAANIAQAARIRQLEASLAVFEQGEAAKSLSLKDSKLAMKSRIASLQAEVDTQSSTIQKLRGELAAANERLALQSAQFMEEMRRLGGAATASRRGSGSSPQSRRSLADRIGEAQPALANTLQQTNGPVSPSLIAVPSRPGDREKENASEAPREIKEDTPEPLAANGGDVGQVQRTADTAPERKKSRLMDRIAGLTDS